MAELLCLWSSAMADPHGRAPLLGGSGVGQAASVRSFESVSLVLGAFLEAPNSYEHDSRTVAKVSSKRTQRSLFRRIQRSFDPPNTSKRRRTSKKRTVGDPEGGPLAGRELGHGMAELSACGARPWPTHMAELPCWGARGSARQRRFALLRAFPWFSGLFSKHRTRMNVILEPLRRSLRYGRNGPCFVGFRGRLTLQTP